MGRRYFANKLVIDANLNAQTRTEHVDIHALDVVGYTFNWSGGVALVGTFFVEVSFDGIVWVPLASAVIPLSGASGGHDFSIIENRYKYLRGVFDVTAGSADFQVWYSGASKGI